MNRLPSLLFLASALLFCGQPTLGGDAPIVQRNAAKQFAALFIANTGDDRILRLDLGSNVVTVFAEGVNGADGLAFDDQEMLWVAANQADQITVLDSDGRVIAELGEFLGVKRSGAARGLSFPASLVLKDKKVFVTNLALPLSGPADPESEVTRYTVSRIDAPRF